MALVSFPIGVMAGKKVKLIFLHSETWIMLVRLVLAGLLSGLIGLEREVKKHPAGFRTHLLVGLGSCLVMILSFYGFESIVQTSPNIRFDPSRLPAYVISGIGFLGGGTILVQGATVRGLTTAASIWVVSGIGIVVGAGMYVIAIFTTIVVILSLIFLNKWEQLFIRKMKKASLIIELSESETSLSELLQQLRDQGFRIDKTAVEKKHIVEEKFLNVRLELTYEQGDQYAKTVDELSGNPAIKKFTILN